MRFKEPVIQLFCEIKAPINKVWDALTNPQIIKKYLFGTNTESNWKKGSPIYFRGTWQGQSYEDKGEILEIIPEKHLAYTHWSSLSGMKDFPENYKVVVYDLKTDGGSTFLTLTQDNNKDEKAKVHSEESWKWVFEGLKKIVEDS